MCWDEINPRPRRWSPEKPRADHQGVTVTCDKGLTDVQDWIPECHPDDDVTSEPANEQVVTDNGSPDQVEGDDVINDNNREYMDCSEGPIAFRTRASKRKTWSPSPIEAKRMREEAIGLAAYFYSLC